MPWVGMMVEDNDKLEKVVDKLVEKRRLDQIKIAELEAEPDKLSKLVVATKGSLSKARRMLSEKVEELGKANGTMVVLESDKRELWGKLKDVQEFVTEKKKYKKRLEQAEEAASVVPDMEERIFQLENIQRDLEKKLKTEGQKNKALTDRVLELERDK